MARWSTGARFSPDSTRIIVLGYHDQEASLWDVVTGGEVSRIHHDGPILATAFSSDGTRMVSFSAEGTTRLWDTATGREQPWGTRTRLWDAAIGREQPWTEQMAHWTATFSPDGTRLATASAADKTVRPWDPTTGQEMTRMPHDNTVTMIAFSPDGTLEAYRFRRHLYYAICAILVSTPSSYSEGVRYPS